MSVSLWCDKIFFLIIIRKFNGPYDLFTAANQIDILGLFYRSSLIVFQHLYIINKTFPTVNRSRKGTVGFVEICIYLQKTFSNDFIRFKAKKIRIENMDIFNLIGIIHDTNILKILSQTHIRFSHFRTCSV